MKSEPEPDTPLRTGSAVSGLPMHGNGAAARGVLFGSRREFDRDRRDLVDVVVVVVVREHRGPPALGTRHRTRRAEVPGGGECRVVDLVGVGGAVIVRVAPPPVPGR